MPKSPSDKEAMAKFRAEVRKRSVKASKKSKPKLKAKVRGNVAEDITNKKKRVGSWLARLGIAPKK